MLLLIVNGKTLHRMHYTIIIQSTCKNVIMHLLILFLLDIVTFKIFHKQNDGGALLPINYFQLCTFQMLIPSCVLSQRVYINTLLKSFFCNFCLFVFKSNVFKSPRAFHMIGAVLLIPIVTYLIIYDFKCLELTKVLFYDIL